MPTLDACQRGLRPAGKFFPYTHLKLQYPAPVVWENINICTWRLFRGNKGWTQGIRAFSTRENFVYTASCMTHWITDEELKMTELQYLSVSWFVFFFIFAKVGRPQTGLTPPSLAPNYLDSVLRPSRSNEKPRSRPRGVNPEREWRGCADQLCY